MFASSLIWGTVLLLSLAALQTHAFELSDLNINKLLAPPQTTLASLTYDGPELRYWRLVFRPLEFKLEAYILAGFALYIGVYFWGKSVNKTRAFAWIEKHSEFYNTQFSEPLSDGGEIVADGPTDFAAYSTGRRGIYSLHTTFKLLPRHDLIQQVYLFIRGLVQLEFNPRDEVLLDFKVRYSSAGTPGFVWAVVDKNELKRVRGERWDLSLFTKITDAVPVHNKLQVMTEASEINNVLLKSGAAPTLLETLKDAGNLDYFQSLIITDQPSERPDTFELAQPVPSLLTRDRHILLTLTLPPASEAGKTLQIVKSTFELIDILFFINFGTPSSGSTTTTPNGTSSSEYAGAPLPATHPARIALSLPTTSLPLTVPRKLRATRKDWDTLLEKERTKEAVEEEEEKRRAEKRRVEEERVRGLSAQEQAKVLEKERKRAMRKAQLRGARK